MKTAVDIKGRARNRILQTALDLFHRQGIHATSVDQILEKSGTGKSQFYHYFGSKDGLVHAVLRQFYDRWRGDQSPVSHHFESLEDLEEWFQFFIDGLKSMDCERSCPVGTIGADLTDDQELLRQDVRLILEFTRTSLVRSFGFLREKGELSDQVDPDGLADYCIAIMQGGLLLAKIKRESDPLENAVRHGMAYIRSLKGP